VVEEHKLYSHTTHSLSLKEKDLLTFFQRCFLAGGGVRLQSSARRGTSAHNHNIIAGSLSPFVRSTIIGVVVVI
jgi:hypothetical protein